LRHALLEERAALGSVRETLHQRRPAARRAHQRLGDRQVVPDEVELRLLPLGEEDFVGARDRELSPGDLEHVLLSHGSTVSAEDAPEDGGLPGAAPGSPAENLGCRARSLRHQPELRDHVHLVEVEVLLDRLAVREADELRAAAFEGAAGGGDVAVRRGQRPVVRALERAGHRDPVAVGDYLVRAEVRVRERVQPDHRVAGDGVAALEANPAGPLEDAVVGGQRPDRLLVVRVERVQPGVEGGADSRHGASFSRVAPRGANLLPCRSRGNPGRFAPLRKLSELLPMGLTERLARSSSRHPWRTFAAWVAAIVVGVGLAVVFLPGNLTTEGHVTGKTESKQAAELFRQRFPPDKNAVDELIVVRSPRRTVDDPSFRSFVAGLLREGEATGVVYRARDFYGTHDRALVSRDRQATLITVQRQRDVDRLLGVVQRNDGRDGFSVAMTGEGTLDHDFNALSQHDLKSGELQVGLPAALVILVLVFGAVVAGLVPLLMAIVAIVVALGLCALVAEAFTLSVFVVNMLTGMGLALGIDYSLFVVSRYREERGRRRSEADAI